MNEIIESVMRKKGCKMGDKALNTCIICCAPNPVLVARSQNNLLRLLHKFMVSCRKCHMKISVSKTKVLTVSKEPQCCKCEMQGKIFGQVTNFGAEITSIRAVQSEVEHRAHRAAIARIWMSK